MEEWLWRLHRILVNAGWDIVIGLAQGAKYHNPSHFSDTYNYPKTIVLDGRTGLREERHRSLIKAFQQFAPDVIMPIQLADALYAAATWKRHSSSHCRLITCVHEQESTCISDLKACADDIDLAVSVSKKGRTELIDRCKLPSELVIHIPTGVPLPAATRSPNTTTKLQIGYVGRLNQAEKRIHDIVSLLEKIKLSKPFVLHLFGDGTERAFLEKALARNIEDGTVIIHGSVPQAVLYNSVYPSLDILLVLSQAEGGPIVAWEAMAHGIVPIVSDFTGRKEEGILCHESNCLVFPVGDMTAAATCISQLLDQPFFDKLSRAAQNLPYAYTEAGLSVNWRTAFQDALSRAPRKGKAPLPSMFSPGRLPHFNSERLSYWLRKLTKRTFQHQEPGGEWPHAYGGLTH